jgi:RNA polymerase sigma-70 factor (ECF subfamily)
VAKPENTRDVEDATLVLRVAEGDARAYRELVARHAANLHRFAGRMLREASDAEDVVQETFLRLWQRARDYTPDARVGTWLHRITHNLAIDRLRARGRLEPMTDDDEAPISAPQSRNIVERERRETLARALDELPERQALAILLVYFHERSGAEAAEILGVSEEALESLLARARRALKRKVALEAEPEGDRPS